MNSILIIEDDSKIALALALRLKSAGYEATIANDALTGLSAAVKLKPDLLLLDISMPAGNGFTLAERVQSIVPTPIPIIFITASKQSAFRDRARELGAVAFFEKPYQPKQLLATVSKILRGAPSPAATN
jgi:DNA-binding response OmpR family regulator